MKFNLWMDGKNAGSYGPAEIQEMLHDGRINKNILARAENGSGEWGPLSKLPGLIITPPLSAGMPPSVEYVPPLPPPLPAPAAKPEFALPEVQGSGIAVMLQLFAVVEFFAAVIGGLSVGFGDHGSAGLGWLVFFSGLLSGVFMLGFATVIEKTNESSQRLRRIELLLQKSHDDKNPMKVS